LGLRESTIGLDLYSPYCVLRLLLVLVDSQISIIANAHRKGIYVLVSFNKNLKSLIITFS
jgi:hypothetical protein